MAVTLLAAAGTAGWWLKPESTETTFPVDVSAALEREPRGEWTCEAGRIELTFDDGPLIYTPAILDVLEAYDATATFYVVGQNAEWLPHHVARAHQEGHQVQNHTSTHADLTALSDAEVRTEIRQSQEAIVAAGAPAPTVLRPPAKRIDERVLGIVAQEGLALGLWSLDAEDWDEHKTAEDIAADVIAGLEPLSVVLFHDGSETSHRTVLALPEVLDAMQEQGYCTGHLTPRERKRIADAYFPRPRD